ILHPAVIGGTDDEKLQLSQCMKDIVSLLDGSLTQKLSLKELRPTLTVMLDKGIITQKAYQQLILIENPVECSLKMLKSIKRGKADWPLVVFPGLRSQNPDLMQPQEFHRGELNETSGDRLIYVSKEQLNTTEMKILMQTNNLDVTRITSDPHFEKQSRYSFSVSGYSDEEIDEEIPSDTADSEEIPDLKLREYQKELAENAVKGRNTIICAPTGSGKTRVATYIILNHLQKRAENEERKIAFLARTVPLVMQQYKGLKKYLPKKFEVTHLTGDSEDSMHLHFLLKDIDVIVMTPRILENHLKKNCLPHLGIFSMLVFDECHHTRKGEPYNTLMYSYLKTKKLISEAKENGEVTDIKLPQIVGLTASISVEKAVQEDEAVNCILEVCGNLDAESISCVVKNEEELKMTVPVPTEKLIKLREIEQDEAVKKIIKLMNKLEEAVHHHVKEINNDELKTLLKKIPSNKKSQLYGQWTVKIRNMARAFPRQENRETISPVRALIIIADYLSAYNNALELHDLVLLEHVLSYLDKCFSEFSQNENRSSNENFYFEDFAELKNLMKTRKGTENPNLTRLKETLLKYLIESGDRCIIFVRTRALTEALASWLNSCSDAKLRDLKATVFTGTAASVDQGGMTTAEQDEVIQRFQSGDVRLLVSTSVGEEGIDIPECNLVIKYNHVGNEVTTVQTRGRSRKKGGMSILLAMDSIIRKERINQEKAKMMEKAIKRISQMKRASIRKKNKIHQLQIMRDEEIQQIVKAQEERKLQKKDFKMVCHRCRRLVIESKDIKTIFQTHHVVVDKEILKQTKTIPYSGPKYIDEMKLIGSVRCMGEPEEGKHCYSKLGSMMVYSKIPFFVIGIKYFGFDSNGPLEFYNQWKKVPYAIDEIGPSDFERYLPDKITKAISDESEDDSDDDSDDDDDDNNQPPNSVETSSSTDTKVPSEQAVPDNPGSVTEQKMMPSSQDSNNSVSGNRTEPKRLQTHWDRDSGFPKSGSTRDGSKFPPGLTDSITAVKEAVGNHNLVTDLVTKSGNVPSAQPSMISSFKSNDEHHLTPVMPMSHVQRSAVRIEEVKFLKQIHEVLVAPSIRSVISDFIPQPPSLPLGDPSASINSDDSEYSADQSCITNESDIAHVPQISSSGIPANTPEVSGDSKASHQSTASPGSVSEALITNDREGSVGAALVSAPPNSNAADTPVVNMDISGDIEETTVLKVAEVEGDANDSVQQEQLRPNIDDSDNLQSHTRQPTSVLALL
ncbi:unnamed protein product, partial [Candidula unifasciata]